MRRGYTTRTGRASANIDPRYIVDDGDLLFSWSGSLELVFWTHGPGALNQHLFKVTSDEFPQWFCWGWIREHLDDFRAIAAGKATTMGHIQRHHLTDATVAVPPPHITAATDTLMGALIGQYVSYAIQSRALMEKAFGDNGFEVYRLPQGQQISPEEFSEFDGAYRAFVATRTFNADMRSVMEQSRNPIVFVEGVTDQRYMDQAAKLLDREAVLSAVGLRDGGGKGKLTKIWKDSVLPLTEILPYQVLLLFDCDAGRHAASKDKLVQRSIPIQDQNPIQEGIENMFTRSALNRAREYRPEFLITEEEHGGTDEHGQAVIIPEKWTVNESQKPNLCDWLCDNGTAEDFQHFQLVLDLIEEALDLRLASTSVADSDAVH